MDEDWVFYYFKLQTQWVCEIGGYCDGSNVGVCWGWKNVHQSFIHEEQAMKMINYSPWLMC